MSSVTVPVRPALCTLHISDGLMTTLGDLYDNLQVALGRNAEALRRALIRKPGLRCSGGAFETKLHANTLYITLGSAVFKDYSVFIPRITNQVVQMELPEPGETSRLYVVLTHATVDSHPYDHKAGSGAVTSVDVATRDTAAIEIRDTSGGELVICELEDVAGAWRMTNVSNNYRLELTSSCYNDDVALSAFDDVNLRTTCLAQLRPDNYILNGASVPLDHEGNVACDVSGAVLCLSWLAPSVEKAERVGGIAYYKVRATPLGLGGKPIPERAIDTEVFHHPATDGASVKVALPCANGTRYEVSITEVDDTIAQRIALPVTLPPIRGGARRETIDESTGPALDVYISQPFSAKNVIKIRPVISGLTEGPYICQVFVHEWSSQPSSPADTIAERGNLIYEGPANAVYHTIVPTNPYYMVQVRVIDWLGQIVLCDTTPSVRQWGSGSPGGISSGAERIITINATNMIIPNGSTSTVIASWTDTHAMNISRVSCCMPKGCNADGEMMWGNSDPDDNHLIPNGGTISLVRDGATVPLLNFGNTGRAYVVFDPVRAVPAANLLELKIEGNECRPYLMSVMLYVDDGWNWAS